MDNADAKDVERKNSKLWLSVVFVALALVLGLRLSGLVLGNNTKSNLQGMGKNGKHQLASADTNTVFDKLNDLTLKANLDDFEIKQVKSGHYHSLILGKNGRVFSFGDNSNKAVYDSEVQQTHVLQEVVFELEAGELITQIDTTRDHNIALSSNGRVFTWGSNFTAQLGNGTNESTGKPTLVDNLPKAVSIAAGYRHSAAVTETGEVYGWGGVCSDEAEAKTQSALDKLGDNISALGAYGSSNHEELDTDDVGECSTLPTTFVQSKQPVKLEGLEGKASSVSIGYGHVLVATENGQVYSAGCNSFAQLGRAKAAPTANELQPVVVAGRTSQISAGFRHSAVLLHDGNVQLWGYNGFGKALNLGLDEYTIPQPELLIVQAPIVFIETGHDTTFAVQDDGNLLGWGQDDAEAFWPLNTTDQRHEFGWLGKNSQVSVGLQHLLAVKEVK